MRRWLLLILLVLVPLQFSSAAVAAYCADEKRVDQKHADEKRAEKKQSTPAHLGHHECPAPAVDSDGGDKPGAENGCGICHLASLQLLTLSAVTGIPDLGLPPIIPIQHPAPQNAPEPSDRPPISPAA